MAIKLSRQTTKAFTASLAGLVQATGLGDPDSVEFQQLEESFIAKGAPKLFNLSTTAFRSAAQSSNLLQVAGGSAKAGGIFGLIVAAVIVTVSGVMAIADGAAQAKQRALAVAAEHGEEGATWGRHYQGFWDLAEKKPYKLPGKARSLQRKIKRLRERKGLGQNKRDKKIYNAEVEASALATVMSEILLQSDPPNPEILEEVAAAAGGGPLPKERKKSTLLPILAGAFAVFQLLG